MAHESYCYECGSKGRTIDGLCHDCELALIEEAREQYA